MPSKQTQARKPKLKPQHQVFVDERAKGKSQTDAYQKAYPKASRKAARAHASRLVANGNISDALQKRIQRALNNQKVTPEEVVGSAVFQMRSSINDVLDDDGSFSIEKARETGAVDLLKKHKETIKTTYDPATKQTQTTKTVEIEMLTNQDGRKEVANYIGVERFAPDNVPSIEDKVRELYRRAVEKLGFSHAEAIEGVAQLYPEVDVKQLFASEGVSQGDKKQLRAVKMGVSDLEIC